MTIIDTLPAPSAATHISIKADFNATDDVELLDSDDDDDDQIPIVTIGDQKVPLNEVFNNSQLIATGISNLCVYILRQSAKCLSRFVANKYTTMNQFQKQQIILSVRNPVKNYIIDPIANNSKVNKSTKIIGYFQC